MNQHLEKVIKIVTLRYQKPAVKQEEATVKINESVAKAAFYYEKLRNVIDYQDEHLFLKNAIKRILKRFKVLPFGDIPSKLLRELVWAGYFKNDALPLRYIEDIDQILKKYEFIQTHLGDKKANHKKVRSILSGLIACDIETLLSPAVAHDEFIKFAKQTIAQNIQISEAEMGKEAVDIQIDIAIERLLFKADYDQLFFKMLKHFYPDWPDITKEEGEDLAKNFTKIRGAIDSWIVFNKKTKIQNYVKKQLPVFLVLWNILVNNTNLNSLFQSPARVREVSQLFINSRNKELFKKVMRALVRGVVFILLTKTILVLLIEYPYEARIIQDVNYFALGVNMILPPLILLIAGSFIKIPGRRNNEKLVDSIETVVFQEKLPAKPLLTLKIKKSKGYAIFNVAYSILSLAILILVGWGLYKIHFNPVSIAFFYIFVSIVSFLAFRTRATAKELEIEFTEDSWLVGIINFVLLPFVSIGKYLSDKWSEYNFMLFFWDFIIEAPFKTVISVFESWLSFTREKREKFE